jgi:hypothetical protein
MISGLTSNIDRKILSFIAKLVAAVIFIISSQTGLAQQFTVEQTLSDEAQRTTKAFDGLSFIIGSLDADSFFPPGKVADFGGFQYLRDNDPTRMGHNTDFLFTTTSGESFPIIGTGVTTCYNNTTTITCPIATSDPFYGQFPGVILPSYQNNGNVSITDLNTELTWQRSPDQNGNNNGIIEKADKLTWTQIQARVSTLNSTNWGGHSDWRIPSIKELYSLTNWNGTDPSGLLGTNTTGLIPFLDNNYFQFAWGQTSAGERLIDVQYASSNMYNELSFAGYQQLFGFNFADGRIKGYDLIMPGGFNKTFSFTAVRGNPAYGINDFVDNGDQTITDNASGLMWTKNDSQAPMNWEQALAWAQSKNAANYCGYNDWRLPNAKELQSIIDYTRSPGSTNSAAINPVFNCTSITNEAGGSDWPWYWTNTTHRSYNGISYGGAWAVYICFGRAAGWIKIGSNSYYSYRDVHGAGAQRSSPKSGTYLGDYMGVDSLGHPVYGLGPQGDILRINNYVRLVRGGILTNLGIQNIPEGFYDLGLNRLNMKDTFKVYLRNVSSPYTIVDSAKAVIDSITFSGNFLFPNVSSGTYFIALKHRNSIETWSKSGGESIIKGSTINYDFTNAQNKAYGNNLKLKGTKWCIYSGEVTVNYFIEYDDLIQVYNKYLLGLENPGYYVEDVTGNGFVEYDDLVLVYNNYIAEVYSKNPLNPVLSTSPIKVNEINNKIKKQE